MSAFTGPCSSCCECPAPVIATASIGASKSKCGVHIDSTTTPPTYYLTETTVESGSGSFSSGGVSCSSSYSNTAIITTNSATCAESCVDNSGGGTYEEITSGVVTTSLTLSKAGCGAPLMQLNNLTGADFAVSSYPNCFGGSSTTTVTYSAVYSTSTLIANAVAALPSFPALGSFHSLSSSNVVASADLTEPSEASYSCDDGKYQMAHSLPPNGFYKITWVERFYPDVGPTVDLTTRSYTWNGTTPPGYDPSNSATWPKTPTFTVTHPATNGEIGVTSVVAVCYER